MCRTPSATTSSSTVSRSPWTRRDASLRLGQTASVSITTATKSGVLNVPSAAVSTVGDISTVTVRKDGKDTTTVVQIGLVGDSATEITSGLSRRRHRGPDHHQHRHLRRVHLPRRRPPRRRPRRRARLVTTKPLPVIDLAAVTKTYGDGDTVVHALAGVDLLVERGDYVAVMGASGSGKSTLMNIVGCLDSADPRPVPARRRRRAAPRRAARCPGSATARSGSSSRAST